MRTIETIVYTYDELSDTAKQKAIETNRYINTEYYDWYDCTNDDTKGALTCLGFSDIDIMFTGFSSQGDGACFTGKYVYMKGALASVKKAYPQWEELHTLAKELQSLQQRAKFMFSATIKHSGYYAHENSVLVSSCDFGIDNFKNAECIEDWFIQVCRSFMKHIYRSLESEYTSLISDESVIDTIKANEYEFLANGVKA